MKVIHRLISRFKDHRGAVAIIVAISMAVLIGIAALSIDVGYITTTKGELKNIADAAVLAAARQLGEEYSSLSYVDQQSYVCDRSTIVSVANEVAEQNKAAGKYITITDANVIIGTWTGTPPLTNNLNQPNAVSVTARRDSSANTPVTTFFAKIFGIDDIPVTASATAALTKLGETFKVELPVGISREWFEVHDCNSRITFRGKADCAAWHCFSTSHCSCKSFENLLEGIKNGSFEPPEITAGETKFSFSECSCCKAFDELDKLFDVKKLVEEPHDEWTTTIVVYDLGCREHYGCHKLATIIGFATITITDILVHEKEIAIEANFVCEYVTEGRSGGGEYGTYGNIPSLVE